VRESLSLSLSSLSSLPLSLSLSLCFSLSLSLLLSLSLTVLSDASTTQVTTVLQVGVVREPYKNEEKKIDNGVACGGRQGTDEKLLFFHLTTGLHVGVVRES
jgi:hypothetical protein